MAKTFLSAAIAVAVLSAATTAQAAFTITATKVANYAADVSAVPNSQIIWDFDAILADGYKYAPSTAIDIGSTDGIAKAPGDDPTIYGTVNPFQSPATFVAEQGLSNFSFLVGSPEDFNQIYFYDLSGDLLAFYPYAGLTNLSAPMQNAELSGPTTAYRIAFDFGGQTVGKIAFHSTGGWAFEYDRFATTDGLAAAPEPGTWALMLIGFGLLGARLRADGQRFGARPRPLTSA